MYLSILDKMNNLGRDIIMVAVVGINEKVYEWKV